MKWYIIYIMTIILIIAICVQGSISFFSHINTTKTLAITKVGEYTVSPVENLEEYSFLKLSFTFSKIDLISYLLLPELRIDNNKLNPPYNFGRFEKYPDYFAELAKIPVDKFDIKHNTYIVCFEHELEKITYKPKNDFGGMFVNVYANTSFYFKGDTNPNTIYIYEAKKCKLDSIDNARMNDLIYIDGMNLNEYRETHNEKQNQT